MFDDGAAILGDERVECVGRLEVREIGPCAEHAQCAQLPAVLVRDDVVGIVGTRAVILETAQDLAGQQSAGNDTIRSIGSPGDVLENRVHIVAREPGPRAGRTAERRLGVDVDMPGIERLLRGGLRWAAPFSRHEI